MEPASYVAPAATAAESNPTKRLKMSMPQMSGTELMRKVKTMQPGIKVILMSGEDPGETEAFAFLAKPFRAGPLVKVIEDALTASQVRIGDV